MAAKKTSAQGRTRAVPKIMLLLRIEISSGRQQLAGIFRFLKSGHAWNVRLLPPGEMTPELLDMAVQDGVKGIISSETGLRRVADLLPRTGLAVVAIDAEEQTFEQRAIPISFIRVDDAAIGRMAATHLLSCGSFRSFGFVPDRENRPWARRRERAFREQLASRAEHYEVFPSTAYAGESDDRRALRDWLLALPKPTAILAAYDVRAATVVEICRDAGIAIPGQLVLVGVDNDELYSDNLTPSLSSVEPDFENEGYRAAQEMERLLRQRRPGACRHVRCAAKDVIVRGSTRAIAPAAHLVKNALDFIRRNALKGIRVPDVVAHLRCSRRLADLRFREFQGESIRHCIERHRLDEVKRRLAETDAPLSRIAAHCGFTGLKQLEKAFRARYGQTLRDWRAGANASHAASVSWRVRESKLSPMR